MNYEQLIITKHYLSTLMLFLSPSLEMKERKKKVCFAFSKKTQFFLVNQNDLTYQLPFKDLFNFFG